VVVSGEGRERRKWYGSAAVVVVVVSGEGRERRKWYGSAVARGDAGCRGSRGEGDTQHNS